MAEAYLAAQGRAGSIEVTPQERAPSASASTWFPMTPPAARGHEAWTEFLRGEG